MEANEQVAAAEPASNIRRSRLFMINPLPMPADCSTKDRMCGSAFSPGRSDGLPMTASGQKLTVGPCLLPGQQPTFQDNGLPERPGSEQLAGRKQALAWVKQGG